LAGIRLECRKAAYNIVSGDCYHKKVLAAVQTAYILFLRFDFFAIMIHENITALKRGGPYGVKDTARIITLTWSEYDYLPVFCLNCLYLIHAIPLFQVYTDRRTTTRVNANKNRVTSDQQRQALKSNTGMFFPDYQFLKVMMR
jgi:hypothetical protein